MICKQAPTSLHTNALLVSETAYLNATLPSIDMLLHDCKQEHKHQKWQNELHTVTNDTVTNDKGLHKS